MEASKKQNEKIISRRKCICSVVNWFSILMDYVTNQSHLDIWYDVPIWNKRITAGKHILDVLYKCMIFTNY